MTDKDKDDRLLDSTASGNAETARHVEAIRRLREPLEHACDTVPALIEILRREGYVFNRFPRDMRKDPPVGDGERWEALAFSLYVEIAGMATEARIALEDAEELLAVDGGCSSPSETVEPSKAKEDPALSQENDR